MAKAGFDPPSQKEGGYYGVRKSIFPVTRANESNHSEAYRLLGEDNPKKVEKMTAVVALLQSKLKDGN